MSHFHSETHRAHRIGWLRAAVMGANDGIVSTASLLTGVAASGATTGNILIAGVAGLVAGALTRHDALAAHARDELGITEIHTARPMQAALASAATFVVGAVLPLIVAAFSSRAHAVILIPAFSVVSLALLGGVAARAGGAPLIPGILRVSCWGAAAMAATALVGKLFGAVV